MFRHLFCNLVIASTIPLPELMAASAGAEALSIYIEHPRQQQEIDNWRLTWRTPTGEVNMSHQKSAQGHLLRFPFLADFYISPAADRIQCHPAPDIPLDTIRHLLLDQVLPRCLAHQGMLMLHASAVIADEGVVIFLGPSGEGKSTLAGYFHHVGDPVLSDDCVCLPGAPAVIKAAPSYRGLRLWQDVLNHLFPSLQNAETVAHYSSKRRLSISPPTVKLNRADLEQTYPVLAFIALSSQDKNQVIHLEELPRRQAFIEVMKQTYLLDLADQERIRHLMQVLGQVILKVRSFRLFLPHDYNLLPLARQIIREKILSGQ